LLEDAPTVAVRNAAEASEEELSLIVTDGPVEETVTVVVTAEAPLAAVTDVLTVR